MRQLRELTNMSTAFNDHLMFSQRRCPPFDDRWLALIKIKHSRVEVRHDPYQPLVGGIRRVELLDGWRGGIFVAGAKGTAG